MTLMAFFVEQSVVDVGFCMAEAGMNIVKMYYSALEY